MIADAVAEGLLARNSGGGDSAEEPMAEWERELLESDVSKDSPGSTQTSNSNLATIYQILSTVQEAYQGGIMIEIEAEDDAFEVEIVHEGKLHELDVAHDGVVKVKDVKEDDDDIQHAPQVTVSLTEGLAQAVAKYPNATVESIELENKDGSLFWEIELKDDQGSVVEFDLPATKTAG